MNERVLPYAALMLFGIGWGASIPLSKIAVSGGHMPLGLIFWQFVLFCWAHSLQHADHFHALLQDLFDYS